MNIGFQGAAALRQEAPRGGKPSVARIGPRLQWLAGAFLLAIVAIASKPALRWADIHWAAEAGKDAWARAVSDEDWSRARQLPPGMDYRWLSSSQARPLVAHALGEAALPGQNTVEALRRSLGQGLRLLEVDLWLDSEGRLRCHHGPPEPQPARPGDCEFPSVLREAVAAGAWVVLDIKTDFRPTGDAVVRALGTDEDARHVVFQLYRPQDFEPFSEWARLRPLAGPIVTAYLARRSLNHVAANSARKGVQALTVPLYRRAALTVVPKELQVFVHPVHDCAAVREAASADGLYVLSSMLPLLERGCQEGT